MYGAFLKDIDLARFTDSLIQSPDIFRPTPTPVFGLSEHKVVCIIRRHVDGSKDAQDV